MSIKILLIDDHMIIRQGLRELLKNHSDIEVIGEAGDGMTAVKLARKLQPDLIVMDINMSEFDGIDATRRIMREFKNIKVIALSMHPKKIYISEMLRAGAAGYLLKENSYTELSVAIKAVMNGEIYLCRQVTRIVASYYIKNFEHQSNSLYEKLASREREVFKLLVEGRSSKEIALLIDMSLQTVDASRRNLMKTLKIKSIPELVKFAFREGLVPLES